MSPRKRKRRRAGCSVDTTPGGKLRLRFRAHLPGVGRYKFGETLDLLDTPEDRRRAEIQADLIGAEIQAGAFDYLRWFPQGSKAAHFRQGAAAAPSLGVTTLSNSPSVGEYYDTWIAWKVGERVRRSRLRDYRGHFQLYILPILKETKLAQLSTLHLRDLQMHLRKRTRRDGVELSEKTVKNVILGSLKAMIRDARRDGLNVPVVFEGLEWQRPIADAPDPFTEDERDRLIAYFRAKEWKFAGFNEKRQHYAYYAFLNTLFFSGCRPSELAALRVSDLDLSHGVLYIRRSRHLGAEAAPKTPGAQRTVRLGADALAVLEPLLKLASQPDDYVFVDLHGKPIDQSNFAEMFRRAERALGIRMRKLYATKHTYVSLALTNGVNLAWLSGQTGVALATLDKHYGRFIHTRDTDLIELAKIEGKIGTFGPRLDHETDGSDLTHRFRRASGMSPTGFEPVLPT